MISKRRQRLEIGSSHRVRWAYANCDESEFYRPLRRAALLQLAGGIAEDPQVLAEAAERVRAYLAEGSSLDPNLASPTLELAARGGGKKLYQAYLRCMRRAATPQERSRFQLALGAFRDPALIEHTLELVLTRTVPAQDVVIVLMRLLANPSARDATWSFISSRWEELEPRMTTGLVSRLIGALPELQTQAQRTTPELKRWLGERS